MWSRRRLRFLGELLAMSLPELAIFACLLCMGCAGVIPLPKATHTPLGPNQPIRLDFLQVGHTTRAEVAEKLKVCDTGVHSERFFVGRWASSGWGWFIVTQYQSDGGRHWSTTNLLVEFDSTGVAKRFETFPDRDLIGKLSRVAEEYQQAESDERIELAADPSILGALFPAKVILSGGNAEFHGLGSVKRPKDFTIPASKISNVTAPRQSGADPVYSTAVVHFSEPMQVFGGPKGKVLYLRMTIRDVVKLLSYVRANAS